MVRFWAFIYRLTGWYSPFARLAEYKHLKNNFDRIEKIYNNPENDMSIGNIVSIEIGMWQAKHGFFRKLDIKKLFKRVKKRFDS
jgi:hypothetical protein